MSTTPVTRSAQRCAADPRSQPTPRATSQVRMTSQAPVSTMNHSPSTSENAAAEALAGMNPGRNATKKTPILGLNRLDSSPLRYTRQPLAGPAGAPGGSPAPPGAAG